MPINLLDVTNAGLVLCSPFFPKLFEQLDLFEQDEAGHSRWRDKHCESRAVYLMQYLADECTSASEPPSTVNKILCGLQPTSPVESTIQLTSSELAACDALLTAVLTNWTDISNSSISTLRANFLQRPGTLELCPGKTILQVQRKAYDMLLDRIPWSFAAISHPWMSEPLQVVW
jgi:hypothetical protein